MGGDPLTLVMMVMVLPEDDNDEIADGVYKQDRDVVVDEDGGDGGWEDGREGKKGGRRLLDPGASDQRTTPPLRAYTPA